MQVAMNIGWSWRHEAIDKLGIAQLPIAYKDNLQENGNCSSCCKTTKKIVLIKMFLQFVAFYLYSTKNIYLMQ